MSTKIVNGDTPSSSSAFLSHLTSYPIISDSLHTVSDLRDTVHSNKYAAKPLALGHKTIDTVTNISRPYLNTPYQYLLPYLSKADNIGDSALSSIDSRFPIVKKPTGDLYNDGKSIVFFPVTKSLEGKDYVWKVYGQESKKTEKEGLVGKGRAVLVTGLLLTSDVVAWLGSLLKEKKAEVKEAAASEK